MNYYLPHKRLPELLQQLNEHYEQCLGPQVKQGTIVYDELHSIDQLPWQQQDEQSPGRYRLKPIKQRQAFAFANGPQAIKPLLFKPKETLWRVERNAAGKLSFAPVPPKPKRIALFGVKPCDIAAMLIQDKVFTEQAHHDAFYQQQREQVFIIVVNCGQSGNNCFCVSAGDGPQAKTGFDLAFTELARGFVVEIGSLNGQHLIDALALKKASRLQAYQAKKRIQHAAKMQTKTLPHNNSRQVREILVNNLDHPRWQEVAERCLSCGNCTAVCPTCFCHHQTDAPSIDGSESEHQRQWDSCFNQGHSYIHGMVIRNDSKSRYKQWLTHKLGTWWDQFDESGCVGCGRCITWCPVGIDLTEEMMALATRENDNGNG